MLDIVPKEIAEIIIDYVKDLIVANKKKKVLEDIKKINITREEYYTDYILPNNKIICVATCDCCQELLETCTCITIIDALDENEEIEDTDSDSENEYQNGIYEPNNIYYINSPVLVRYFVRIGDYLYPRINYNNEYILL